MSLSITIQCVILAAGESRRFNGCKQLAALGGQTLIARAVALAQKVAPDAIHIVLGANAERIQTECGERFSQKGLSVHEHPAWAEGMGSSLAAGMKTLPSQPDAVLLLLADQVRITGDELQSMINTWEACPDARRATQIVCADYGDTLGVPALFPAHYFPELKALKGSSGAKKLISRYASNTVALTMPSASIDIDTVEQLAAERARWSANTARSNR